MALMPFGKLEGVKIVAPKKTNLSLGDAAGILPKNCCAVFVKYAETIQEAVFFFLSN